MKPSRGLAPILLLAAGLGCLKPSPPVVLYTLQPLVQAEPGAPRTGALALEVLPVRLPELLRRPQMVVAESSGALGLSETHRWGNLLELDMQRVLVADLGLLLGSGSVVPSPYGARVGARYQLEVTVQRCDGRGGDGLVLQATWMVTRIGTDPAVLFRRTRIQEPMAPGPDALAAAHSRILAALSREIAAELGRLPGF